MPVFSTLAYQFVRWNHAAVCAMKMNPWTRQIVHANKGRAYAAKPTRIGN